MAQKKPIDSLFFKRIAMPLGAFGLALLLWIFVVSENEYTMMMDFPIEARNLNVQKAHREEVPQFATVRLKGTGRDLFKSTLLKKYAGFKLVLDLEGISQEYEFILNEYFEKYPQKVVLPSNYNISFVEIVHPNRIQISLDDYKVKTVSVLSNLIVIPTSGHIQVGNIKITPNQIQIAGPKEELALINHVETILDTVSGITIPLQSLMEIESLGKLINYSHDAVMIKLNIQEIGERIIVDIPVNVINIKKNIRVFPSPQTISLTVVGGVQRIAKLNPEDIQIIIDFNSWNRKIQFYEPIVIIPADVLEWRDISPRSLELGVAREVK
jgi:YbbR domain-containing protein